MNTAPAKQIGSIPSCETCGSTNVVMDAWAAWNPEAGFYELEQTFDHAHCHACDSRTTLVWTEAKTPNTDRIRELNDLFRTQGIGSGSVMITAGIRDKGQDFMQQAVSAVQAFDQWSEDSDPWGEHDFGAIDLEGQRIFFKLDPYNLDCTAGSENPANAAMTHRVLTIMLAHEY